MRNRDRKKKLVGPWRNIHGAVWLIGLAILAWKNWWWPGILVLIAASGIVEALIMQFAPNSFEEEDESPSPSSSPPPPEKKISAPVAEHRPELLPSNCLRCGAPIRGHEVKWTGAQSANCPYCGANLPMEKST
jgi:hypothetical protein